MENFTIPEISPRLRVELDDLRERYGVDPTLEEALWLARACERCDNVNGRANLDLIGIPVEVGGVRLWPHTIGSVCWLEEFPRRWWEISDDRYFWAQVYALANARNPGAFTNLTDEGKAEGAFSSFRITLGCNRFELDAAIDEVLDIDADHIPASKSRMEREGKAAWDDMVQELETTSGIPAETWLWGKSAKYTIDAFARHRWLLRRAHGNDSAPPNRRLDEAITQLARVKNAIWRAHGGGNGNVE